ncbi:MAG: glycoside hydrolase [Actinomycetota bacterium]|nr:glycoside hydrolase [Actinomycetota bacterium]
MRRAPRRAIAGIAAILVAASGLLWTETTWGLERLSGAAGEDMPRLTFNTLRHHGIAPDPTGQAGSGGRAVAHYAGGRAIPSGTVAAGPDARLYRTGYGSWEPTMGVTKDGTVYFDAETADGGAAVVRSEGQGRKWKAVYDGHVITADPYLFVDDRTSRIFEDDYVPPCHVLSFSDNGTDWTTPPPTACGYNADHQTLFSGPAPKGGLQPQGYPNILYLCSISGGISIASTTSACSKSLDGGQSFVPTGEPAFYDDPTQTGDYDVPGLCNGANGHGFVARDGTVYLPRGWCGQPWLAISHDEGTTWTRVQVSDLGMPCCGKLDGSNDSAIFTHEAAVAADGSGNVYYAWVAADRLPYLAVSRNGGKSWGKPMMIGPPGVKEALLPGIAVGRHGGVVVRYMGSTNSPWNGEKATGSFKNERWNAYLTETNDPLTPHPVFYSATVNDASDPMWVGECGPDPVRCGWGDFQDVVVDRTGSVWSVDVDLCVNKACTKSEAVIGHLVGGKPL